MYFRFMLYECFLKVHNWSSKPQTAGDIVDIINADTGAEKLVPSSSEIPVQQICVLG